MKLGLVIAMMFALLSSLPANARDISGTWQGTQNTQLVIKIFGTSKSGFRGEYFNLGTRQASDPTAEPVSSIKLQGRSITFDLDRKLGTYSGTLTPDNKSMIGTWQMSGPPQPLRLERVTRKEAWVVDASPHKVQFVTVTKGVRLEVLDWGGSGPPLLFLTGWGNTAHVFDRFAPKFTDKHHVYGITRRGFGISSAPPPTQENFDPDRLADDVLAIIDAMKLAKPVLVGHSVAGQEMSSIGTRHPEKVAGLIYLDAAFSNAFYDPNGGYTAQVEADDMRRELEKLPKGEAESPEQLKKVLRNIPLLQKSLERDLATVEGVPEGPPSPRMTYREQVSDVMATTRRKYVGVKPPFLAIIAAPYKCNPSCDIPTEKAWAAEVTAQADAVQADYPSARVVRLPNANHYVFRSNEAEVTHEMNAFMDGLPH